MMSAMGGIGERQGRFPAASIPWGGPDGPGDGAGGPHLGEVGLPVPDFTPLTASGASDSVPIPPTKHDSGRP